MSAEAATDPSAPPAILLVDDEPLILETTVQLLGSEFAVETASSAEEASLCAGTRRYDAIVCDHMLPGEQGLEFLTRMARQQPQAGRILLTGYVNPELISRSVSVAGLSACLLKPVGKEELLKAVRTAAGRAASPRAP